MEPTATSTAVAVVDPAFSDAEQFALSGFLAGYRGLTRDAYALDLRQFVAWCEQHQVRLFEARRADIECFARDIEERGRARATVARRLCTVAGFYRYAEQEGLLAHSPAVHVRRPRLDYDSHATGLDRNEVGALLVAAGLGSAAEHALVSLLAINGLRVSEAIGADIEALGLERGHRTLTVCRKGGKIATIPLAPRTARAIDLAIGERAEGPRFATQSCGDDGPTSPWRPETRRAACSAGSSLARGGVARPAGRRRRVGSPVQRRALLALRGGYAGPSRRQARDLARIGHRRPLLPEIDRQAPCRLWSICGLNWTRQLDPTRLTTADLRRRGGVVRSSRKGVTRGNVAVPGGLTAG